MPIVMQMSWPEITKEQYDAVRKEVHWEAKLPPGARYHVAYFAKDGFHVCDVWESAQQFSAFVETRLMPAVLKTGAKTQPKVEISETYAIFAPSP